MTLTEVEILMQELGKHIHDDTQIIFGTAVDSRMGNRLSVTLISSLSGEEEEALPAPVKKPARAAKPAPPLPIPEPEPVSLPEPPIWEPQEQIAPAIVDEEPALVSETASFTPELLRTEEVEPPEPVEAEPLPSLAEEPEIEESPPPPRVILPRKKPTIFHEPKPVAEKKPLAKQEVMQFEPVTRGRFEKSEPTIVEGQDLDVPTFLRKNVRVK
jgi:cell division protein FtsZ